MTGRIGIVTGIAQEHALIKACSEALEEAARPLLRCAGMDGERAAQMAADLMAEGVDGLLSFGVAGGLDPALKPGDLVLPEVLLSQGAPCALADKRWLDAAFGLASPASIGPLVTSARVVMTAREKAALYRASHAVAVDMESHPIASFANSAGVPFIALRVIIDPAHQDLPAAALAGNAPRTLGALLRRPQHLPGLIRLARNMAKAKRTLGRVGRDGLPRFGL
jgi:adenosylhomocysteine nucleosidase